MLHKAERGKQAWPDDVTILFKVDWRQKLKNDEVTKSQIKFVVQMNADFNTIDRHVRA